MSRLTGTDAYGLMEAYSNVYAPQELTEEQVWEEVENWVNSLVEEGYDLSDYTWEEMFESYINEASDLDMGLGRNVLRNRASKPTPSFQNTGGYGRYGASRNRFPQPQSRLTPGVTTVPIRPRTPGVTPAPTNRPAAPTPINRPAATAPASPKPAAPAGGSALDRATAAASKPAAFSPKPQSDVGAMIARSQARQAAQTPKPSASAPAARPMGSARERMLQRQSFDVFDVIKGHLIDEGYADTEESALVIMANMSEEWKESIVEARVDDGKSKEDKRKIRTARSGRAGVNLPNSSLHTGDIDRRHAHRTTDDLNKDARDIRRGKLNLPQFQGTTGRERVAQVKKEKGIR